MKHELATRKVIAPPEGCEDDEDSDDDDSPRQKRPDVFMVAGFKCSLDADGSLALEVLGEPSKAITAQEFKTLFLSIAKELRPQSSNPTAREVQ